MGKQIGSWKSIQLCGLILRKLSCDRRLNDFCHIHMSLDAEEQGKSDTEPYSNVVYPTSTQAMHGTAWYRISIPYLPSYYIHTCTYTAYFVIVPCLPLTTK